MDMLREGRNRTEEGKLLPVPPSALESSEQRRRSRTADSVYKRLVVCCDGKYLFPISVCEVEKKC